MDYTIYKQMMGQINKSCIIQHHNFPSHNLLSTETLLRISKGLNDPEKELEEGKNFLTKIPCFQTFDYKVRMCFPLYCGSSAIDVAANIVKKKMRWERKLKKIKVPHEKEAIQSIKNLRKKKETKLSQDVTKYLKHFQRDPEPNFKGNYNWLYTGGNLSISNVNDALILIGANCTTKSAEFNVLKLNANLSEIDYKLVCSLKKNSPILQLSSRPKQCDLFIVARQKNNMSLFKVKDASHMKTSNKFWRKKVQGDKLLTSVDISGDCQMVIAADSKSDVHIYDTETGKKVYCFSHSTVARDNWNQIMYNDDKVLMADRNIFCVFDSRDFYSNPSLEYNPSGVTNECENICAMMKSSTNSNYIYLGTTHNLIQIDVRSGKSIQRWTHLLKDPPQFLTCLQVEDNDFMVAQSWRINETLGIINGCVRNGNDVDFHSKSLPCALTSVKEFLRLARMNGLCLSPSTAKKFDFSVTGIQTVKKDNGEILLFTANSAGDIFLSQIKKKEFGKTHAQEEEEEEENGNVEFLQKMNSYEVGKKNSKSEKFSKRNLDQVDLTRFRDDVKNSRTKNRSRKRKLFWEHREMFSEESLRMCKDVIAQKILKVWGYDSEESKLEATMTADERVRQWIEKL